MNKNDVPSFLVTNVTKFEMPERIRCFAETLLLSPCRGIEFNAPMWNAWVPGNSDPISCEVDVPTAFTDGVNAAGEFAGWLADTRSILHDSLDVVINTAANRLNLIVSAQAMSFNVPFFLGPQGNFHPTYQSGKIALLFQHLDQSADVMAHAAYYEHLIGPYQLINKPKQFLELAHRTAPRKGYYLPISVLEGERTIAGCIRLGARKTWPWKRNVRPVFEADLFWNDRVRRLASGTILFRNIVWQEDGVRKEIQTEVAEIISIEEVMASS